MSDATERAILEELKAENARLRAALEKISEPCCDWMDNRDCHRQGAERLACEVLGKKFYPQYPESWK